MMRILAPVAAMLVATAAVVLLAGCDEEQKQRVVAHGQLFCGVATAAGPLVVAVADAAGTPIVVTGVASNVVAAICGAIKGIPVTPPVNQAAAPVVAVPIGPERGTDKPT